MSSVLDHFGFMLLVSFVGFSFFGTKPKGWLGRMSPKAYWDVKCFSIDHKFGCLFVFCCH